MFMFLRIERPTTATLRPISTATSIACCIRWTFDANDATRIRPLPRRDELAERLADEPLGAGDARPLGVRRVAEQQVDAAVADLREPADVGLQAVDRRVVELPVAGERGRGRRRSSITTATASGIECAIRTNSSSNGPMLRPAPSSGSASRSSAARSSPCSSSFDLTSPSVSRVAQTSRTRTSRSRYGSAPTWSSCAVREHDRAAASLVAQVREVGQDEVDAEVLVAREREPGVDDDQLARRTRRRSCSCRPRRGRRAG